MPDGEPLAQAEPRVRFSVPDAGWIRMAIAGLEKGGGEIACTYIADPFPAMIEWLEAIVAGKEAAVWVIPDEGATNVLTFVRRNFLGADGDHLCVHRIGWDEAVVLEWPTDELVRDFYTAIRTMVAQPDYVPREWEWSFDWRACDTALGEDQVPIEVYDAVLEANPYDGANLRQLRSAVVEEYLSGEEAGRQGNLF